MCRFIFNGSWHKSAIVWDEAVDAYLCGKKIFFEYVCLYLLMLLLQSIMDLFSCCAS